MKQTCGDIMTPRPACVLPSDPVARAARIMKAEDVGSVPVVDGHDSNRLLGIVTDRDVVVRVVAEGRDPAATRVEEVMTRDPVTCRPEDEVEAALDAMGKHQVRRIPIVENRNRLVGIIAQADVATRLEEPEDAAEVVREISQETSPVRPTEDPTR
ncbi:MAG TPA: CBS domain-containing protein [Gemmatimonadales bacterium]|nr:CBS domain-containing protein [Gemmatimonadales bacterium]